MRAHFFVALALVVCVSPSVVAEDEQINATEQSASAPALQEVTMHHGQDQAQQHDSEFSGHGFHHQYGHEERHGGAHHAEKMAGHCKGHGAGMFHGQGGPQEQEDEARHHAKEQGEKLGGHGGRGQGWHHGGGSQGRGGHEAHHEDVLDRLERIERRQILIETMLRELVLGRK